MADNNDEADIDQAVLAKSDRLNADDLIGGPIVVTITDVKSRDGDKTKCTVIIAEAKPYHPNTNMTRIMSHAWGGGNGKQWIGKRLKLFRNPEVVYGGEKVGGIEISNMSHIAKAFSLTLNSSNRKKRKFTIERLEDEPAKPEPPALTEAEKSYVTDCTKEIASAESLESLTMISKGLGKKSDAVKNIMRPIYAARKAELTPPESE